MISIAIFIISACTLAMELVLVRVFAIGHWHHFAHLVISTALLGFGSAGTFVTIFARSLKKHFHKSLWFFAIGLSLLTPVVFVLAQKVGLDELQLIWDKRQIVYLFAYYLLFFVPFFFAAAFIALTFTHYTDRAHRLYFFNMAGSGFGAAAALGLLYSNRPEDVLLLISLVGCISALLVSFKLSTKYQIATLILAVSVAVTFSSKGPVKLEVQISPNKSLVYYRALPDYELVATRYSPLGRIDCVSASTIRNFPSLSMTYRGTLPEQMLIITDAEGSSAVSNITDISSQTWCDYTTDALSYHLLADPSVCIIGAGGGSDVIKALALKARQVTAVEMNPQIVELMQNDFAAFSSGLYLRDDVNIVVDEARTFLQTTDQKFDIINIAMLDSFTASAAGVYSLNESHLYTIQAVDQMLSTLDSNGILSITRMLKNPPRDCIKMFATVTETLRNRGISDPRQNIIMIRNWAAATILVSPSPFTPAQLEQTITFTEKRSFDLVFTPGIKLSDTNKYHVLPERFYYEAAQKMLSPDYRRFYDDYLYNITPATDDRPYFFDFFKLKALPALIKAMPRNWLVFSEWGYIVLVATLLQAVIAGGILILIPLWLAKPLKQVLSKKAPTFIYFLLIGLGYMFLEMAFIQKLTLLIGHPVFAVGVTLSGFLVFSGLGALSAGVLVKIFPDNIKSEFIIRFAVTGIIVVGLIELIIFDLAFGSLIGMTRPARIVMALLMICPLAFFMGMPFPTALKQIALYRNALVPWAWGINGFASVIAAVLGTVLAISFGFTILSLLALVLYFLAAAVAKMLCRVEWK